MSIIYISALLVFIIFGVALYVARREVKCLRSDVKRLRNEIKRLETELEYHRDVKLIVPLTLAERQIILGALKTPQCKDRVTAPATKHIIRSIYNALVRKIKKGIEDQGGLMEMEEKDK